MHCHRNLICTRWPFKRAMYWAHGGASLNLTRELTPVLTSADGKTLIDRAIYVEDASGGYYTLKSGAAVLDAQGQVIARPSNDNSTSLMKYSNARIAA